MGGESSEDRLRKMPPGETPARYLHFWYSLRVDDDDERGQLPALNDLSAPDHTRSTLHTVNIQDKPEGRQSAQRWTTHRDRPSTRRTTASELPCSFNPLHRRPPGDQQHVAEQR